MASGFAAQQENRFFFVVIGFFLIFFENFGIFANLMPQNRTSGNLKAMISKSLLSTKGQMFTYLMLVNRKIVIYLSTFLTVTNRDERRLLTKQSQMGIPQRSCIHTRCQNNFTNTLKILSKLSFAVLCLFSLTLNIIFLSC